MNENIDNILQQVAEGKKTPEEARELMQLAPYLEMSGGISLDTHRKFRTGQMEVVFARGKTNEQLYNAVLGIHSSQSPVMATKVETEQAQFLLKHFPGGTYWSQAGLFVLGKELNLGPPWNQSGDLSIVTAGASDMSIALEAMGTAQFIGLEPALVTDVGVAGLHRITPYLQNLKSSRIVIVVAGMEGALPSVLSGILDKPILAVPTSVGYGASLNGLTALMGMLSSCAPGVSVVNIDNGFGAAVAAGKILNNT